MKTSEQLTLPFGETVSAFSPADSLASRSASPENAKERKTPATYGPQCSVSFGLFDRDGSLARTFTESLIGRRDWSSNRRALTWRKQDTRCNRTLYRLAVSALPTVGTDAGLLPTVQTQGLKRCVNGRTEFMPTVLLPTPHASDASRGGQKVTGLYKKRKSGLTYMSLLNDLAASGLLPTPTASDAKNVTLPASQGIRKSGLPKKAMQSDGYRTGAGSRLNPLYVAEMMGFPVNWTALPFLRGAENRSKPTETP